MNPEPGSLNPEPGTEPRTQNPEPRTQNQELRTPWVLPIVYLLTGSLSSIRDCPL
jgi:hypothetical protein